MTGWLLVVILFLWVSGGFAWVNSYELAEGHELTGVGTAVVMVLWPLMGVIAALSQVWSSARSLTGSSE